MPRLRHFQFDLPLIEKATSRVTQYWREKIEELRVRADRAAEKVNITLVLTAQGASIGATDIPLTALTGLPEGLYRVAAYARVTRAGSVSSSLALAIGWTDGAAACSRELWAAAAMNGNTDGTTQGATAVVQVDMDTQITYTTTYADGGGATAMLYELRVYVESLPGEAPT